MPVFTAAGNGLRVLKDELGVLFSGKRLLCRTFGPTPCTVCDTRATGKIEEGCKSNKHRKILTYLLSGNAYS